MALSVFIQQCCIEASFYTRTKESLFSAVEIARSSNNIHPCVLFDGEFWHSQNVATAITTAVRGDNKQ